MKLVRYARGGGLTNYLPLPRALLELDLSGTALLLYALLLDRATLSQKNGWWDREGWVYVRFPIPKLAAALGRGTTAVKRRLAELERAGLIYRMVPKRGEASQIFLYLPEDAFCTGGRGQKDPGPGAKRTPDRVQKGSPNNLREPQKENHLSYQYEEEESL
ncbi:hypothetical protein B5G34_02895 [Flavonifractor sp. An82]|uniref:replication initiator protein A n=1 Tax=Flavonifractor sp. An82 TaxID=1965660 RepID=UPI000B372287|nr:replication initiator protein A [Flavonifractor sp. An82]OUN24041.1 hypothetical protein B5G34_02895 [Flavonifractor sp. An82]